MATQSSATTVWGPGALSGRAIKSLGEASLRGFEKLLLRWRLAKIETNLPALASGSGSVSKNTASGEQLEKMMDDLLEMSRLDFYDAKVRQKALRMIMMQIGSGETHQLLFCVVKWPREEIIIFLSEMMPCIPLLWHKDTNPAPDADTKARLDLITVYRSSQLPSETHEVLPFINFICRLAQEHESACLAVIESGFLDSLVTVCDRCIFDQAPAVIAAVKEAIGTVLRCQRAWHVECTPQRLDLVWPRLNPIIPLGKSSLGMTDKSPNVRRQLWLTSAESMIVERLCEAAVILSIPELCSGCEKDLFDLSFDLLVFCDLDIQGTSFTELSMSYLLQIITLGGDIQLSLQNVLTLLPYHNKVDFFYRIIHPLSRLQLQPIPTATKFCEEVKIRHPEADPVDFFLNFAMDFADISQENARAVIDAEIISLIIANRGTTPNIGYVLQRIQNAIGQQQSNDTSRRPRASTV